MTTTSLKIPDALKERLSSVVASTEKSAHAFMLQAIEEAVEFAEEEQAWLAEIERRAATFEKTRMGITEKDMYKWLDGLARGEKLPPPKARKIPRK